MRTAKRGLIGLALVGVLALAACGSDNNDSSSDTAAPATTAASSATTAASSDTTAASSDTTVAGGTSDTAAAGKITTLDTNGDGKVVIGVATPGPRNDGAYYQALVDGGRPSSPRTTATRTRSSSTTSSPRRPRRSSTAWPARTST